MLVKRVVAATESVERLSRAPRLNESLMIATPVAGCGVTETRIRPVPPSAISTRSVRPEGSSVETVSTTPGPILCAAITVRAEY